MANEIKIGGRLHSVASGNVLAGADEIIDDNTGKKQSVINAEVQASLATIPQTASAEITGNNPEAEPEANAVIENGEIKITLKNIKGEKGDPLRYSDLNDSQKAELKGDPGDNCFVGQGDLPLAQVVSDADDKAITPQGVKKAVEVIHKTLDGSIDLTSAGYTHYDKVIGASSLKWSSDANRESMLVPVSEGDRIYLKHNTVNTYGGYVVFMSTDDEPVVGASSSAIVPWKYIHDGEETETTSALKLMNGEEYELIAPAGAHFLYLQVRSGSYTYLPEKLQIGGVTKDLEKTAERVSKLENSPSKGVFDISVYNAVNDVPATYANFALAIAAVPASEQRGGMSVQYIERKEATFEVTKTICDEEPTQEQQELIDNATAIGGVLPESGDYEISSLMEDYEGSDLETITAALESLTIANEVIYKATVDNTTVVWRIQKTSATSESYKKYSLLQEAWSAAKIVWQGINEKPADLLTMQGMYDILAEPIGDIRIDLESLPITPGAIVSNKWNTSASRKHIAIPIGDIKSFKVGANDEWNTYYRWLSEHNPVVDTNNGVMGTSTITIAKSTEEIITPPSGAKFLYIQSSAGADAQYRNYMPRYVSYEKELIGGFSEIKETQSAHEERIAALEEGTGGSDGIVALNNPKTLLAMLVGSKWNYDNIKKSFTMVHFSDMHGKEENLRRIEEFVSEYNDYISMVLHTGDLVANVYNHPIYWNNNSKFMLTTGNHDCTDRIGTPPDHSWVIQDQSVVYGNLFAPYIANWNVTRPENATTELYYYKDFTTFGFRLVVMDSFYWDNNEATWLANVLEDAKENELQIILASHYGPFAGTSDPTNPFDSMDYDMASGMSGKALPVVDAFIEGGGSIICWLCGHMHADGFRMDEENHPGILAIAVSAAGQHLTNQEYPRQIGTKAQDLFNLYSIDTDKKILSIIRIGADYDHYMRHKGTLVYDYESHRIISIN